MSLNSALSWEQRKLGEVGETYTGLSGKSKDDFGHGSGKFITYMNVFSNPVASSNMTEAIEIDDSQNKVQFGDVLFTTSSETPDEVGMSSVWLENAENTYLNSFCFGYRPTTEYNPYYLAYMLRSSSMRKKITFLAQGISRYNISKNKMMDIEMPIPSIDEQKQIGEYFRNLDNLITLHQRKYDKLTNVKKSMLEKMFPKNGSNVPEIRFKGFTEAWEQRELWELTIWDKKFNEVEAEKQPKIVKYPYVLADVFSKIEDASGDVRLLSTGNYIGYTTDEKAGKNLCVGEVVAIPWGGVPNIKYYKGKFVTADNRIATSNDTETLGNRFLSLYLEHSLAFLQSIYRGASIKHPSMNDVLSMQISIPHIQEQREIETWFANLDNLITLHQRKWKRINFAVHTD